MINEKIDLESRVKTQRNSIDFMLGKLARFPVNERLVKQKRILEVMIEVGL